MKWANGLKESLKKFIKSKCSLAQQCQLVHCYRWVPRTLTQQGNPVPQGACPPADNFLFWWWEVPSMCVVLVCTKTLENFTHCIRNFHDGSLEFCILKYVFTWGNKSWHPGKKYCTYNTILKCIIYIKVCKLYLKLRIQGLILQGRLL